MRSSLIGKRNPDCARAGVYARRKQLCDSHIIDGMKSRQSECRGRLEITIRTIVPGSIAVSA
jgi:hypothetical protein